MKFFDPHIHMTVGPPTTTKRWRMRVSPPIVEPAFWVGQPRSHVGTFEDYFLSLLGWERFRASQFGIRHFARWA
jgi:predicted metal-dependent TIM-barrel fold hydrolase